MSRVAWSNLHVGGRITRRKALTRFVLGIYTLEKVGLGDQVLGGSLVVDGLEQLLVGHCLGEVQLCIGKPEGQVVSFWIEFHIGIRVEQGVYHVVDQVQVTEEIEGLPGLGL